MHRAARTRPGDRPDGPTPDRRAERRALDRRIAALAVPAAVGLLTDPLYDLCDTAILGHLGPRQLAGAAVATRLLSFGYATFVFVMFATTAAVARRTGEGRPRAAVEEAVGATWVGAALGVGSAAVLAVVGHVAIGWFGARGGVAHDAWTYLWISLMGFPAHLVVMAGVGYHRGVERARLPLAIAAVSVLGNLAAELLLIVVLGFGVGASAATTVVAKWGAATTYLVLLGRAARRSGAARRPTTATVRRVLEVGRPLVARTAALLATIAAATALAGRLGTTRLAAHSVAFAIWSFAASLSDGTEVAGQALVAHALGRGSPTDAARAARRIVVWATRVGVGLAVLVAIVRVPLAGLFTDDAAVTAAAASALWWVAALQPVGAVAFSLDGVLIGARCERELALIMVAAALTFGGVAVAAVEAGAGLAGVWAGLAAFMGVRLVPALRLASRRLRRDPPELSSCG